MSTTPRRGFLASILALLPFTAKAQPREAIGLKDIHGREIREGDRLRAYLGGNMKITWVQGIPIEDLVDWNYDLHQPPELGKVEWCAVSLRYRFIRDRTDPKDRLRYASDFGVGDLHRGFAYLDSGKPERVFEIIS